MKHLTAIFCLTITLLLGSSGVSYALPDCPEDQTQRYHNCFGTDTFRYGDKYVGEYKDNRKNGQGTYTYGDGKKYVGEFKDNTYHGEGTLFFADGRIWKKGIWKDGEFLHTQKGIQTITVRKSSHPRQVLEMFSLRM
jgi:hypothetical protein